MGLLITKKMKNWNFAGRMLHPPSLKGYAWWSDFFLPATSCWTVSLMILFFEFENPFFTNPCDVFQSRVERTWFLRHVKKSILNYIFTKNMWLIRQWYLNKNLMFIAWSSLSIWASKELLLVSSFPPNDCDNTDGHDHQGK